MSTELNRREFIKLASLAALSSGAPDALAEGLALLPEKTLLCSLDFFVRPPEEGTPDHCLPPGNVWLILRPVIVVKLDALKTDPAWLAYLKALQGMEPLGVSLWPSSFVCEGNETFTILHVTLPSSWPLHLAAYDKHGQRLKQFDRSILRQDYLKVTNPTELDRLNEPRVPDTPAQAGSGAAARCVVSTANAAPAGAGQTSRVSFATIYDNTLLLASKGDEAGLRQLAEQTDLTLSLGTRRYISPDCVDIQDTRNLMVLRQSDKGLIETNLHSLLGLTVFLGAAGAEGLKHIARILISFDSPDDLPEQIEQGPLGARVIDTNNAEDPKAIANLFGAIEGLAQQTCEPLNATWDPDAKSVAAAPALDRAVLAERSLTASIVMGTLEQDGKKWNLHAPAEGGEGAHLLSSLFWINKDGKAPGANETVQVHPCFEFKTSSYLDFQPKVGSENSVGHVYKLSPREPVDADPGLFGHMTQEPNERFRCFPISQGPADPIGGSLLRAELQDEGPGLFLITDAPLSGEVVRLVQVEPMAKALMFEPIGCADEQVPMYRLKHTFPTANARYVIGAQSNEPKPLYFWYQDHLTFRLAQSIGRCLARVRIDHACAGDNEREEILGDRLTHIALNLYEATDAAGYEKPSGYIEDPLGSPASKRMWINPHVELYPIAHDRNTPAQCEQTAARQCPFESDYLFELSEPMEAGRKLLEDLFHLECKEDPDGKPYSELTTLRGTPQQTASAVRDYFNRVYRRAGQERNIFLRAEGTYGTELNLGFAQQQASIRVPTVSDWPTSNPARVRMGARDPGQPLLGASLQGLELTLRLDTELLALPADFNASADHAQQRLTAFLEGWRSVCEVAHCAELKLHVTGYCYDHSLNCKNSKAGAVGKFRPGQFEQLTALAGELKQACVRLINGQAVGTLPVAAITKSTLKTHAVEVSLEVVRKAAMAPATDNSAWQLAAMSDSPLVAACADKVRRLHALPPLQTSKALEDFLEQRRRSRAVVARLRDPSPVVPANPGHEATYAREALAQAFLALGRQECRDVPAGSSDWHIPVDIATPAEPKIAQVSVVALAFRSPQELRRYASTDSTEAGTVDLSLGEVPYDGCFRLCEALSVLTRGQGLPDKSSKQARLQYLDQRKTTLSALLESLADLLWPTHMPTQGRAQQLGEQLSSDSPERAAVKRWCMERLRQEPRFFIDTKALLLIEIKKPQDDLAKDFSRAIVDLETGGKNPVTEMLRYEDRLTAADSGEMDAVWFLVPLADDVTGHSIKIQRIRLERFEGELAAYAKATQTVSKEISFTVEEDLEIQAALPVQQSQIRLPARRPVAAPRIKRVLTIEAGQSAEGDDTLSMADLLEGHITGRAPSSDLLRCGHSTHNQGIHPKRDDLLVRYVLELEGDSEQFGLQNDALEFDFASSGTIDLASMPSKDDDPASPLAQLLRTRDFKTMPQLQEMLDNLLKIKPGTESGKILRFKPVSSHNMMVKPNQEWPSLSFNIFAPGMPALVVDRPARPTVWRHTLYVPTDRAKVTGGATVYYLVCDIIVSRFAQKVPVLRQVRNACDPTDGVCYSPEFAMAARDVVAPPTRAGGVVLKAIDDGQYASLSGESMTVAELLQKVEGQLGFHNLQQSYSHDLSITAFHRQVHSMDIFRVAASQDNGTYADDAYVPLKQGQWAFTSQPAYKDKAVRIGGDDEDQAIRHIATDLEWRDSENRMAVRVENIRLRRS